MLICLSPLALSFPLYFLLYFCRSLLLPCLAVGRACVLRRMTFSGLRFVVDCVSSSAVRARDEVAPAKRLATQMKQNSVWRLLNENKRTTCSGRQRVIKYPTTG